MTEPAKNEAELVQRVSHAIWQNCDEGVTMDSIAEAALAAIRAAGWAVVPVTEQDALRAENARLRESLEWFLDNDETNEGDEPMPEYGGSTWNEINEYWIDGLNRARAALAGGMKP